MRKCPIQAITLTVTLKSAAMSAALIALFLFTATDAFCQAFNPYKPVSDSSALLEFNSRLIEKAGYGILFPDMQTVSELKDLGFQTVIQPPSGTCDTLTRDILLKVRTDGYGALAGASGRPAGLIGQDPGKAITFLENERTERNASGFDPFPGPLLSIGYAYIMTHPGTPAVYYPHLQDQKLCGALKTLAALRMESGITPSSSVRIMKADRNCYAATIDGILAVRIGNSSWQAPDGFEKRASGPEWVIWTLKKSASNNPKTSEYFPGYGQSEPGYTYRKGLETKRELMSSQWVINRLTIFKNEHTTLYLKADLLPELLQTHPDLKVKANFPFILDGHLEQVVMLEMTTRYKLFFRKVINMGKYRVWFELMRRKNSIIPGGKWEKAGETYEFHEEPASPDVATEFKVLPD